MVVSVAAIKDAAVGIAKKLGYGCGFRIAFDDQAEDIIHNGIAALLEQEGVVVGCSNQCDDCTETLKALNEEVEYLKARERKLLELIRDLSDGERCTFDHHGGCQSHGYLSLAPGEKCPMGVANEIANIVNSDGTLTDDIL